MTKESEDKYGKIITFRCPTELLDKIIYLRATYPSGVSGFFVDKLSEYPVDEKLMEMIKNVRLMQTRALNRLKKTK